MDWHVVALPVIQDFSPDSAIAVFRNWLARLLILTPIPALIDGDSEGETLWPDRQCRNFGRWFWGIVTQFPRAYGEIEQTVQTWMSDFKEVKNPTPSNAKQIRSLGVIFQQDSAKLEVSFDALSDGEKTFFICALVLAAQKFYGPIFCFWDEPDNYLTLSEVGYFIPTLRRAMEGGGQFLATSHHPETIRKFSDENTFLLYRDTHSAPTRKRRLTEMEIHGDLIDNLIQDDLDP